MRICVFSVCLLFDISYKQGFPKRKQYFYKCIQVRNRGAVFHTCYYRLSDTAQLLKPAL